MMGPLHRYGLALLIMLSGLETGLAVPLPYEAKEKHLGVATCGSSVCHGAVRPNTKYDIPLNEYIIWARRDSHATAYETLLTEESKTIAKKLGIDDPHKEKICLDCHTDNISAEKRGEEFQLSDGIGCETCHGGSEKWIESHAEDDATYEDNLEKGMYPTADLEARGALCLSCHYGNNDKFTTHKIMGAGHPRLSFELDTFTALQPPHFQVDDDYKERKKAYSSTMTWLVGQLAAASWQTEMLQGKYIKTNAVFPELALFDCHACHANSMHDLNWRKRANTVSIEPGAVPINDGHLRMAYVIAKVFDADTAKQILRLSQALQRATGQSRDQIAAVSRQLNQVIDDLEKRVKNNELSARKKQELLVDILDLGSRGEYRDYIGAEQAVMAVELVMIDQGIADKHRSKLDGLYRLVEKDEAFNASQFSQAFKSLKDSL